MAIPTPTIPSAVNPVSAVRLSPTLNNKAFSVNSGIIGATNTETTVLSIADIGKRDVLFCVNPILTTDTSDNMVMKIKNNGSIIYQTIYDNQMANHIVSPIHFIISANTNIEITFTNGTSTSRDVGVSCYGYYLEAF